MFRRTALACLLLLAVVGTAPATRAESDLDFTLANGTGYGIKGIFIAPSAADTWGSNLLSAVLENGDSVAITFHPSAEGIEKWDLKVAWVDEDEPVYWKGFVLSEISKITLKYNRKSGETTAVTE